MTVLDYLEMEKIDLEFIESNFEGQYWESVIGFLKDNSKKRLGSLSDKQVKWLSKILEDCVEKRIEG